MEAFLPILQCVGGIFSLASLVLAILVCVKMIQNGQQTLGIVSIVLSFCLIGQFIALVYGWMKAQEWQIQTLMKGFTACLALSLVMGCLQGIATVSVIGANSNKAFNTVGQSIGVPVRP